MELFYYLLLVVSAIVPVIVLCYYIYRKDVNKEPFRLLRKLFLLGFAGVLPVLIAELFLEYFFPTDGINNPIILFINIFIDVALMEEGYKWIMVRFIGFNNKEFDEIYDIIVYSVFVSLGFACIENIFYVLSGGFSSAILRALLSIPGHMCFAIVMGYFLAKAKVSLVNNNKKLMIKNSIFSIVFATLVHTIYDFILMYSSESEILLGLLFFLLFDIVMVVTCIITVNKISKIQKNITSNLKNGTILPSQDGHIAVNHNVEIHFCPVCGRAASGENFCTNCGCKLK